jgi:hypothetical protein
MKFDVVLRDLQLPRDLFISQTLCHQGKYLMLAGSERFRRAFAIQIITFITDFATALIAPPLADRASLHIITTPDHC